MASFGLDPTNVEATEIFENSQGQNAEFFFLNLSIHLWHIKQMFPIGQAGDPAQGGAQSLWQIHTPGRLTGSRVPLGREDGLVGQD